MCLSYAFDFVPQQIKLARYVAVDFGAGLSVGIGFHMSRGEGFT
jgi:hypothetical protein